MHVELYERIWIGAALGLIVVFLGAIVMSSGLQAIQPPSHIETIDPTTLDKDPEFSDPKVVVQPDGSVRVSARAEMFSFTPDPIEVPANRPVTFRLTSPDVIHGFLVMGTNANAMVIPGYVTQFTVSFPTPGQYAIACDEYCGMAHHMMVGHLVVKEEGR
jgi:cytochrome c oxidase subunit 2